VFGYFPAKKHFFLESALLITTGLCGSYSCYYPRKEDEEQSSSVL